MSDTTKRPSVFLPAGTPNAVADGIKAANPDLLVIQLVEPSTATTALITADTEKGHSRSSILNWLGIIEGALLVGIPIVVPAAAPVMVLVKGILDGGVALVRARLEAEPNVERWTVARLLAKRDAVAGPDDVLPPATAVPALGPQTGSPQP